MSVSEDSPVEGQVAEEWTTIQWKAIMEEPALLEPKTALQQSKANFLKQASKEEREALDAELQTLDTLLQGTIETHAARYPDEVAPDKSDKSWRARAQRFKDACKRASGKTLEVTVEFSEHLDPFIDVAPEYVQLAWSGIKIILLMIENHIKIKAQLKDYLGGIVSKFALVDVLTKFAPTVAMIRSAGKAYGQFTEFLNEAIKYLLEKKLGSDSRSISISINRLMITATFNNAITLTSWSKRFEPLTGAIAQTFLEVDDCMKVHSAVSLEYIRESIKSIQDCLTGSGSRVLIFKDGLDFQKFLQSMEQSCNDRILQPSQKDSTVMDESTEDITDPVESDFLQMFAEAFPDVEIVRKDGEEHQRNAESQLPHRPEYEHRQSNLLHMQKVIAWLEAKSSDILYINGSNLLQSADFHTCFIVPIERDYKAVYPTVTVLRYFCGDLGTSVMNTASTLLGTLTFQLLKKISTFGTTKITAEKIKKASVNISARWNFFLECLEVAKPACTFIVIDSIDQLRPTSAASEELKLVEKLSDLVNTSSSSRVIKVLLTTRISSAASSTSTDLIALGDRPSSLSMRAYDPAYRPKLYEIQQGRCKTIEFLDVWMLYSPGLSPASANTTIYTREDGQWRAFFVLEFSGMQKDDFGWYTPLVLRCFHIDHNGDTLARRYVELEVPAFAGAVDVTTLNYVPSGYLPKEDEIRERLVARGRRYIEACRDFTFWSTGTSRVIIDQKARPKPNQEEYGDSINGQDPDHLKSLTLILCPPSVDAYEIQSNTWTSVQLDSLSNTHFENSWRYMLLGDREKKVLTSTVQEHLVRRGISSRRLVRRFLSSDLQNDVSDDEDQPEFLRRSDTITGKNNGLFVLFHGPPASGKRSAVEALAEYVARPLIRVTPSELPSDAVEVITRLKSLLYLASRWTAILHIDEADFLFEKATRESSVGVNPLRSAFLREVQLFDSVMIMTTSRIGWADEEVLQMIHLPIYFRDLDEEGRMKVWDRMLKSFEKADNVIVQDEAIDAVEEEWVKLPLNAKQIRNCLVVAVALAKSDHNALPGLRTPLRKSHIRAALGMAQEFMKYMTNVQGTGEERVARSRGLRDDQLDS